MYSYVSAVVDVILRRIEPVTVLIINLQTVDMQGHRIAA
jgi:hypothetical protein